MNEQPVGFTMGIAIVIALSQIGEALGLKASLGYGFLDKVTGVIANIGDVNWYAVGLGLLTFVVTKYLLKVSPFIPAPLIALAVSTGLSSTVFAGKGLTL
ncbi:MAG TPA: SulP family inorganic anion transporter, partial [Blastocatellia bacterium]|nr:SulP family inorganic anion transporter [Blastocatellia bacterium]